MTNKIKGLLFLPVIVLSLSACNGSNKNEYHVEKIKEIADNDDYILGADISSIKEVEDAGGKFYDEIGNVVDCIELLAESGINYARIRLWNDPYITVGDPESGGFQGGGNDVNTDIAIASRAVASGMKVCLDFHYSDFWADPGKQIVPRAWEGYSGATLNSVAAEWTTDVLQQFKDAGCEPSMVQIGNEIEGPKVAGLSGNNVYPFLAACCNAVRSFDPDIKIVLHIPCENSFSYNNLASYFQGFIDNGVDYDVIGLSYYCYWHGSLSSFEERINKLDKNFDKEICLMEYSYGWTLDSGGSGKTDNIFDKSCQSSGGYPATPDGQANCIYDTNKIIANTNHGIGSFYWEPAWLSLPNTSWASTNALDWYLASGDEADESWFGTVTWANQALFDYSGHALISLDTFNIMRGK